MTCIIFLIIVITIIVLFITAISLVMYTCIYNLLHKDDYNDYQYVSTYNTQPKECSKCIHKGYKINEYELIIDGKKCKSSIKIQQCKINSIKDDWTKMCPYYLPAIKRDK